MEERGELPKQLSRRKKPGVRIAGHSETSIQGHPGRFEYSRASVRTAFFKRNQLPWFNPSLNTKMGFIMLEKGIFLEAFLSIQTKLMHGGFSTNLRPWIHSARSLLPSARQCSIYASPAEPLGLDPFDVRPTHGLELTTVQLLFHVAAWPRYKPTRSFELCCSALHFWPSCKRIFTV